MSKKPKKQSPETFAQRHAKSEPSKEERYLLIGRGTVRAVSLIDFAVGVEVDKIAEEQEEQRRKRKEAETTLPVADQQVIAIVSELEVLTPLVDSEEGSVSAEIVRIPRSASLGKSLFTIKPVPLDERHQSLLDLTVNGVILEDKFRKGIIQNGDSAQVEFAVVEGLRRGWNQSRENLGLRPSGERI